MAEEMTKHKKRNDPETWQRRIVYLKQKLHTLYSNRWTDRTYRLAHAARVELWHLYKKLELDREHERSR